MVIHDTGEYLAANQALWDEWAEIHARSEWYDLEAVRQGARRPRPPDVALDLGHQTLDVGRVLVRQLTAFRPTDPVLTVTSTGMSTVPALRPGFMTSNT